MAKYLLKRILYSILSIVAVMFIIMILIFSLKSRDSIFTSDNNITHLSNNQKEIYKARKLQDFGYLQFVAYSTYADEQLDKDGVTDESLRSFYKTLPSTGANITPTSTYAYIHDGKIEYLTNKYLYNFRAEMEAQGYKVTFLNYKNGDAPQYFATRDHNVFVRLGQFFGSMFQFENMGNVAADQNIDRYIRWEWDYASNAPALVGSGTSHKYLTYYSDSGSILAGQNIFHLNLGYSYTGENKDRTIEDILLSSQGTNVFSPSPYPYQYLIIEDTYSAKNINFTVKHFDNDETTLINEDHVTTNKYVFQVDDIYDFYKVYDANGNLVYEYQPFETSGIAITGEFAFYFNNDGVATVVVPNPYDIHSVTYSPEISPLYGDHYSNAVTKKSGLSTMGYSFLIGILATLLSYILGIPLGILMARKKDKIADHIGMAYIIFIIAVPSLAYIAIFRALGGAMGLPTKFYIGSGPTYWLVYFLPVISLALPSIGGLMRWTRRYMIDQSNADYVKFARSQGMSEREIFTKHIARNAAIPIIHGIPGSILGCLTGAFITERFYAVPGTGKLLTTAINSSDNGTIVALAFFYSLLSIISLILGDILLTMVDPRISFVDGGAGSIKFRRKKKKAPESGTDTDENQPAEIQEKVATVKEGE